MSDATEDVVFRHLNVTGGADSQKYQIPVSYARRPAKGNTTGKEVMININSYPVTQFPNKTVYQYDVSIFTSTHS
jgi:eukaryotic translation initiation factor 2C